MSAQHTPTPWFHRQAGVVRHGEAYDWIADHPEQGRHLKIIVQRHACLPEDYAFIVEAVNSYDRHRATIDALVRALHLVDALWTNNAGLGFEAEMSFPSPVGIVWQRVRAALQLANGDNPDTALLASKKERL